MIQELWDKVIFRHGQAVTLTRRENGEVIETKAFLQPIMKEREDLPVTVTPLGGVDSQRWMYFGSAGVPLEPGDRLFSDGLQLVVQEGQVAYWDEDPLYCRAILRREKGAAQ